MKEQRKVENDVEFDVNKKVKEAFTNASNIDKGTKEGEKIKMSLKNNLEDFAIYIGDTDRSL